MGKKILCISIVIITICACTKPREPKDYLKAALNNLKKIQSATYHSIKEGWAPSDTAASVNMVDFYIEYANPTDTAIGASFVRLLQNDTTIMTSCYDGQMRAEVDEESGIIVIDSFNLRKLPFRPLTPPFFNYTKSIIKYALETKDSISIIIDERNESVYFCLTIYEDRQVEFFGKACYMVYNPYDYGETTSKYEIWFARTDNLPFRYRREMSHDISAQTVSHVSLNKMKIEDFSASDYFLPGYKIELSDRNPDKESKAYNMLGKKAPVWMLENTNSQMLSLNDLKGKVKMIQFTSVSCGPCRASIPFLNEITTAYKMDDFDFVAIECTAKSQDALKHYQNKNAISYKLLKSTKSILRDYGIRSFPVFFIIDKDLIIREVIFGYSIGTTDTEISDMIDKMIQ